APIHTDVLVATTRLEMTAYPGTPASPVRSSAGEAVGAYDQPPLEKRPKKSGAAVVSFAACVTTSAPKPVDGASTSAAERTSWSSACGTYDAGIVAVCRLQVPSSSP